MNRYLLEKTGTFVCSRFASFSRLVSFGTATVTTVFFKRIFIGFKPDVKMGVSFCPDALSEKTFYYSSHHKLLDIFRILLSENGETMEKGVMTMKNTIDITRFKSGRAHIPRGEVIPVAPRHCNRLVTVLTHNSSNAA